MIASQYCLNERRIELGFPSITVYTSPGCGQCLMTKKWLVARNIPFADVDLSTNMEALDAVREMGYQQAPVIVARHADEKEDRTWYGFNPLKLTAYVESWGVDVS